MALAEDAEVLQRAENLSWIGRDGGLYTWLTAAELASGEPVQFTLRLDSTQGPLARATRVHVLLPPGWTPQEPIQEDWVTVVSGSLVSGFQIEFSAPASPPDRDELTFYAIPPDPTSLRSFDIFHASVRGGSFSQSSLVVKYEGVPDTTMARAVYPTTPYALRLGSRALFGAVFANGGEETTVKQVDLEIPGGYDFARHLGNGSRIFKNGTTVERVADSSGDAGTWTVLDSRHIQWRGERAVDAGDAAFWLIGVDITDDPHWTTSIEPPEGLGVSTSLTFENGYESTSRRWGRSPGIVEHRVPASAGEASYAWGDPLREYLIQAAANSSRANLAGNASYGSFPVGAEAASLESSIADSSFRVSNRSAPLGSYREARADFRSLVEQLSGTGAQDLEVTLELYAPPAIAGCGPTARWSHDQSSLPHANVKGAAFWDVEGLGVRSVFLIGDEGRVARLNEPDVTAWTVDVGDPLRSIATAEFSSGDKLLVGDAAGKVIALHPGTGAVAWSVKPWPAGAEDITRLVVDATAGRFSAASDAGNVTLIDDAGDILSQVNLGARVIGLERASSGEYYALTSSRIVRLSSSLGTLASADVVGGVGLAVAPAGVLVAAGDSVLRLDASSLATTGVQHGDAPFVRAAAGDADGDGIIDLVTADSALSLQAWSGADAQESWRYEAEWSEPAAETGVSIGSFSAEANRLMCETSVRTYGRENELPCVTQERRLDAHPRMLDVGPHGVLYAYAWDGFSSVALVDSVGESTFVSTLSKGAAPTALAQGEWLGRDAVVVGTDTGDTTVRRADSGSTMVSATAMEFLGQFTFGFYVPEGGFYGTHLLVASVSWSEEHEVSDGVVETIGQAARFVDWFHVVEPNGRPVETPAYHVVLVAHMPDEQMHDG